MPVDVDAAADARLQVREKIEDAVTVFVLPPSYEDLERRLRGRGQDDEETIRRRLEMAGKELSFFATYDYAIVNDDLENCVASLKAVIRAARFRTLCMEGRAREILRTFDKEK